MVVIARTPDSLWHRLNGDGCARARGVLQRPTHEHEDVDEDEMLSFIGDDPSERYSDCDWAS